MTEIAWYWHFLGLKPGATKAEIKSAYHRLAKLLHRDHGGTDEDMQRLNEAYHLALADVGPAYQVRPKSEPRHEPPPPPPPRPEPPPSSRPILLGQRVSIFMLQLVIVGAALSLVFLLALQADNPSSAVATPTAPQEGITYEDAVKLPGKRTNPSEASSSPSAEGECSYATPPYSGPCGRHAVAKDQPKSDCEPKLGGQAGFFGSIECH
jgi:hypothetical protein